METTKFEKKISSDLRQTLQRGKKYYLKKILSKYNVFNLKKEKYVRNMLQMFYLFHKIYIT